MAGRKQTKRWQRVFKRIIVTLIHEMLKRDDCKKGLATLCIGGGNAVATIWEKC